MSFNTTSFTNLISSLTGNISMLSGKNLASKLGPGFNTDDSVQIGGFAGLDGSEDADAISQAQRENFDEAFTAEDVAALFGKEASELTEQQSADLSNLLFDISQENAKRKEAGESPLTKDELNEYINSSITDYKNQIAGAEQVDGEIAEAEDGEGINTLGKTLSELGIEEISDEQMESINKALEQYENGEEVTAAKDAEEAKEAKEAKKAEEAKAKEEAQKVAEDNATQQPNQAQQGSPSNGGSSGGGGNVGGVGNVGGAGKVGSTSSATANKTGDTQSASNLPEMAEDLNGLQQQKADAQTQVGDLSSQIDSKKAEINQRKSELLEETGTDNLTPEQQLEQAKNQAEYDKAKQNYDKTNQEKQQVQKEHTQTAQDIAKNQQDLYAKAAEKQAKSAELSSAQSELSSLTPPSAPSGDDEEAQSAYESAKAEYEAKKAELEARVSQLQSEEKALEDEISALERTGDELQNKQAIQEQKLSTCDDKMAEFQAVMDEKMEAMEKGNPDLQAAIEKDEQLQTLEADIKDLESQKAEQEQFIRQLDQQIELKEKEDTAVQQLRQQEAQKDFETALANAGNPTGEKHGSAFFSEREAVDVTDPAQSEKAIEWARETLENDPSNAEAQAVLDAGTEYLEQRRAETENVAVEAVTNLPDHLKDEANAYVQQAIENGGVNPEDSARVAIAEYTQKLLDNGELSDEDRALVQNAADATSACLEMDETYHKALEANSDVKFYKAVEQLPDEAKAEAYTLRDSINALSENGACYGVNEAYNNISDYMAANPGCDLDMETAQSMFGDYGPVALAALRDESGAMADQILNRDNYADVEGINLPFNLEESSLFDNAGGFKGDTTDMYHDSLIDLANKNVEDFSNKCSDISSGNYSPYGSDWMAMNSMAENAEAWQNLANKHGEGFTIEPANGFDSRILTGTLSEAAIEAMKGPNLEELMSGSTELGLQLAKYASSEANRRGTVGWCYAGVSSALGRAGISIGGPSAFCAVDELDSKYSDTFVKVTSADISKDQLKDLPAGAVVVYGSGSGARGGYHGHIYVSLGGGREASDHIQNVNPSIYGDEYYVYFPK